MAREFTLRLDNLTKTFSSGNEITGKVIFSCTSTYEAKGIRVKLEGKETVQWTEGRGANSRSSTTYTGALNVVDEEIYLHGDGQLEQTIPAGYYEYPFRFLLPKNLPPTFESAVGKVTYEIKAAVVKSWYKLNEKSNAVITISPSLDLATVLDAHVSGEMTKSKEICCLFCTGGSILGQIKIPRKGYAPGEVILFQADVDNRSSRNAKKVKAVLVQVITYHATDIAFGSKTKVVKNEIVVEERAGVSPGESDVWNGGSINVPQVMPSSVGNHIIDFQYFLRLEVCVSGTPWNLQVDLPLTIGTAPVPTALGEIQDQWLPRY